MCYHPAALAAAVTTIQLRSDLTHHQQYLKLLDTHLATVRPQRLTQALAARFDGERYAKAALVLASRAVAATSASGFTSSLLDLYAVLWPRTVSSELFDRFGRIQPKLIAAAESCTEAALLSCPNGGTQLIIEPLLARALRESELVDGQRVLSALWVARVLRWVLADIESPRDHPDLIDEIVGHLETVWKAVTDFSTVADVVAVVLEARLLAATHLAAVTAEVAVVRVEQVFGDCERYLVRENLDEPGSVPTLWGDYRWNDRRIAVARLYLCRVYLFAERFEDAIAAAEAALGYGAARWVPAFVQQAELCLGYSYLAAGRFDEGIALFESRAAPLIPPTVSGSQNRPTYRPLPDDLTELIPDRLFPDQTYAYHLGCAYLTAGRHHDAMALYEALTRQAQQSAFPISWYPPFDRGLLAARRALGLADPSEP
ncbi:hypothetical protein D7D52_21005 [Nocardia yunnanensis]|uniref:Tetratricopeptide repeat protein n=1 Tax=Nocardia yunnanensis TaxID=2382165 RepID=A0A386ZEH3_9NOCA|nr:hypothetical protein D7D52_21005 [Nocardia yunnanensis]